jgi:hypothetical protein
MSASLLVDDQKYSFLKNELDLQEENSGVFDGAWFGNGDVSLAREGAILGLTLYILSLFFFF